MSSANYRRTAEPVPGQSREDQWQRIFAASGPPGDTVAGLLWRLHWLMPAQRYIKIFTMASLALATVAVLRARGAEAFQGHGGFAPLALVSLLPLLYLQFFETFQPAGFTVTSARALALLPVRNTRLRDAAWIMDVVLPPATAYLLALGVMLVLPGGLAFKVWFALGLLFGQWILIGMRAAGVLAQVKSLRGVPNSLGQRLAARVDTLLLTASFCSIFAMMLVPTHPETTLALTGIAIATTVWCYVRTPLLASEKGGGAKGVRRSAGLFKPAWVEIARIYYLPPLATTGFLLMFYVMFHVLSGDSNPGHVMSGQFPVMMAVGTASLGSLMGLRVRAARMLPLTTTQLTAAFAAFCGLAALPLAAMGIYEYRNELSLGWLLGIGVSISLWMTAVGMLSIWAVAYRMRFTIVQMLFFIIVIACGTMVSELLPRKATILIALLSGLAVLTAAWQSVQRYYLWNSTGYRAAYQNPKQMNATMMSNQGETIFMLIYGAVGLIALLVGIFQLIGGTP